VRSQLLQTGWDNRGLRTKLGHLRRIVNQAKRDPGFVRFARQLVHDLPEKDYGSEVRRVSNWIRQRVRYVRDPHGVETFTNPRLMVADAMRGRAAGDCDELVGLGAALLESLGHRTQFRVGGLGPRGPWSHIWLAATTPTGQTIAIDDTRKDRPIGTDTGEHYDHQMLHGPFVDAVVMTLASRATNAAIDRLPEQPEATAVQQRQKLTWGGAVAFQNDGYGMDGFSFKRLGRNLSRIGKSINPATLYKKAGKEFGRASTKVAKKIVPRSVRKKWDQTFGKRSDWGKGLTAVYKGAHTLAMAPHTIHSALGQNLDTLLPMAANFVVPGSGALVGAGMQAIEGQGAGPATPPPQQTAPPLVMRSAGGGGPAAAYQAGSWSGASQYSGRSSGVSPAVLALGAGALVLLLTSRRRR